MLSILLNGYLSQKITKQVTNYASYICCCSFAGDRKSNSLFFLNSAKNLYWWKKKLSNLEKEGLKLDKLDQPIVSWLHTEVHNTSKERPLKFQVVRKPSASQSMLRVLKIKKNKKNLKELRHGLRILKSLASILQVRVICVNPLHPCSFLVYYYLFSVFLFY